MTIYTYTNIIPNCEYIQYYISSCHTYTHMYTHIYTHTYIYKQLPLLQNEQIDEECFKYINRLSDFLFAAARFAALKSGHGDTIYRAPRTKK